MKIHQKLCLGFMYTSILVGLIGCNAIKTNSKTKSSALIVRDEVKQKLHNTKALIFATQGTQIAICEVVEIESGSKQLDSLFKTKENFLYTIKDNINIFKNAFSLLLVHTNKDINQYTLNGDWQKPKEKQIKRDFYLKIERKLLSYKNSIYRAIAREWQNNLESDKFVKNSLEQQYITELLPQLIEYRKEQQELENYARNLIEVIEAATRQMAIFTIVSTIAAIVAGSLVSRSILRSSDKLKIVAAQISQSNFDRETEIDLNDEVGNLVQTVDRLTEKLSQTTIAKSYIECIVNSMSELLVVTDLDARIVRVNQATLKLLNFSENELIGQPLSTILTTEGEQLFRTSVLEKNCDLANLETSFAKKDRQQIPVMFSASIMRVEQEQVQGIVCVACHTAERKKGENIECKELEARLAKINQCFLNFCTDPIENINRLTALLGELSRASCTLYSSLDNGMLCTVGRWQTPLGFHQVERAKGHICYDVIQQNSDEIWILPDLLTTKYAQTDPNIQTYKINTYFGKAVKCQQQVVGSLCALYETRYIPSEADLKVIGIIAAAIGIEEERRTTQKSLWESEQRYALAAQATRDGLWDWNLNTDRIYLSKRSQSLMGIEARSEISATEFYQRVHPADLDAVQVALGEHLAERAPQFESEYRVVLADGSDRWLLSQGLALRDADGKPYRMAGSQTDITERKHTEAQLRHQVYHDELTGLPNRILLMERLRRAMDRQKRQEDYLFAVLFLDLDRFKVINDSLGHAFGDRMLKAIASQLQTSLRPGDTIARLGGDEFALLLEAIADEQEARQIAERIQQQLAIPFYLGEHEIITSASIGIALSALDYEYPEDLLRDADTTMHRAKTLGKARTEIFDPSMHNHAMARLQIEIDLRKALERQELRVFYQPIVSLKTGKITGFEALVRWQHPTSGMIPPIKFIPVAEETGLICAIGWWVLKQACQQTRHWQERFPNDPPLTISVNVSGKQFTQSNLIEQVDWIVQETSLPPTSLKLEITESVLVENAEAAAAVICQLRAMGIQFSIDDFGTGYSSLSYLHRLPIDTLKIDRSFVNNVDCEPEKIEIIRTIVALAWNLGMNVVAEGVETKTQMYQLQALKSEYGQGYFFSKPADSETIEELLATQPGWEQDLRAMAKSVQTKQSNMTNPL